MSPSHEDPAGSAGDAPVILVVDDEPMVRMLSADLLEEAGFSTIEAVDSAAALMALADHPEISVLFTDISMPGKLDGLDLARHVDEQRPGVRLLISSGKVFPRQDDLPVGAEFFPKPWAADDLVAAIRTMLRGV